MDGIYGIFQRDGAPVSPVALDTMRVAMSYWGRDGGDQWHNGPAGLGQLRTFTTPESPFENLPRLQNGLAFTAAGRVDNRDELIRKLGLEIGDWELDDSQSPISNIQSPIPDGDLLFHAYRKWGQDAPQHIYGDWSFAAWHPCEQELFLARDHFGNTSLYYYLDQRVFAFASDRRALLALNMAPIEMDELFLAQVLISWTAYHGERTIHKPLKRLPPAHTLTITPESSDLHQYWRLEDTPELHLPKRADYVEAFLEIFDEAVRCRLRTPLPPAGGGTEVYTEHGRSGVGMGVTLSGGLDSSSVAVTAAGILRERGKRLSAYTSIPIYDTKPYLKHYFGDESPYTRFIAQHAGNIDLHAIPADDITPIQAIRRWLPVFCEPGHSPANFYWMLKLMEIAYAQGHRVLLTGQLGNASISWHGDPASQPLLTQLRLQSSTGWDGTAVLKRFKDEIRRRTPAGMLEIYRRLRHQDAAGRYVGTAIHPDFAQRLNLYQRYQDHPDSKPPRGSREFRFSFLRSGRSLVGALWAEMGAFSGLEFRDPTADPRVLAFTFSVPDHIFIEPRTAQDRWLIREAMHSRLPDEVRLNRGKGYQAGDLVPRLRASAAEVEVALAELAQGPAAAYLDVTHMRTAWEEIQRDDTPEAFRKAISILTRGLMAGLWVNGFGKGEW